ncbi:MAG: endopeptidase La [Deltaproteobacteria bacterium]|nr:MAG: endopeptidase La [Deltaproteobacteria bacterium]
MGERGKSRLKIREEIPILPLRNTVIYPGVVVPLTIGRPSSLRLIEDALAADKIIGIVGQRDPDNDSPEGNDLFTMGTVAQISRVLRPNESTSNVIAHVQGIQRMRVNRFTQKRPYLKAHVQLIDERYEDSPELRTLFNSLRASALQIVELSNHIPQEVSQVIQQIESPGYLADLIAAYLNISMVEKEEILECLDLSRRVQKVLTYVRKELQMLELNQRIQDQVKDELDKNQREYYLRKQLKAIRKELGEEEEDVDELEELRDKLQDAQMPPDIEKEALKELNRLSRIPPQSAEYTVARTYLDWLIELPWSLTTEDNLDIARARQILNEDHYGLNKVKKRILEYLAVRKLKADMKGPILCFVGPPGVGKTSLGRSIARAMGREFVRIALGGVKDEAEIRGHRRTYVGALPGRIIKSLKKAKSNNPVFVLDEVDKLSNDMRGDPASALLEVLDPEQNDSFSDHYLEVPFDLSKVMFIATANLLDPIPAALRDRMEVIEIAGYTEEDKRHIARQYLIDRQHREHGLPPEQITFTDDALRALCRDYTREAGVRNLEREIASICRAIAMQVAEDKTDPRHVDQPDLSDFLGPAKYFSDFTDRVQSPGVATGLAWTPSGGELLFIEATKMKGKGQLLLTGKLGDVMKESAQATLSYLRTHATSLGIPVDFLSDHDIHIHVPSGAIPKDGPSAGVALFTALLSLLTGRRVRPNIAMTGEITLRGVILPVGGIKEKVLAAHRAKLEEVLLPAKNQKDLVEIPDEVRKTLKIRQVSHLNDLLDVVFADLPPALVVTAPENPTGLVPEVPAEILADSSPTSSSKSKHQK